MIMLMLMLILCTNTQSNWAQFALQTALPISKCITIEFRLYKKCLIEKLINRIMIIINNNKWMRGKCDWCGTIWWMKQFCWYYARLCSQIDAH